MEPVAGRIEDPSVCVVGIRKGERAAGALAEMLRPIDPATLHEYRLPANSDVALHYHELDEYWLFTSGHPTVTLRSPSGVTRTLELEPGDMVACVRGVEHTLRADHELVYFQFTSVAEPGEDGRHLTR